MNIRNKSIIKLKYYSFLSINKFKKLYNLKIFFLFLNFYFQNLKVIFKNLKKLFKIILINLKIKSYFFLINLLM